jgi:hypothetical protein
MLLKDGLPYWAFAIVGDRQLVSTWKLPHHTAAVARLGSPGAEDNATVDWPRMGPAVAALSPAGYRGQQVDATPGQRAAAARHLAAHYRRARKPLPTTLLGLLRA